MSTIATLTQILLLFLGMLLMIVVLLQRGRGGGLAGAFGGAGGQSAFGTKAGDVFTKITVVIAVAWVLVAGGSGYFLRAGAESRSASLQPAIIPSTDEEAPLGSEGETGDDFDFTEEVIEESGSESPVEGDASSDDATDSTDETPAETTDETTATPDDEGTPETPAADGEETGDSEQQ